MTDNLQILEDRVNAVTDTTITRGDVSVSWDGLEYTYRAFGREIDRDEALSLLKALEHEQETGEGRRMFRLAASTPKSEAVIYAKQEGNFVRWYRHMDLHKSMVFYGKDEASLFTLDEVKAHIEHTTEILLRGGWIVAVWPELARSYLDDIQLVPAPEQSVPYKPVNPLPPMDWRPAPQDPQPVTARHIQDGRLPTTALYKAAREYLDRPGAGVYDAFRAGAEWQAARITDAIEEAIK